MFKVKYLLTGFVKMPEWWITSGPLENWKIAFEVGKIWGVTRITRRESLSTGDYVLFYVTKPISGVIGYGLVRTKFKQDNPLWPQEINEGRVIWRYRFEFDVEYCLPPGNGKRIKSPQNTLLMQQGEDFSGLKMRRLWILSRS